MPLQNINKDFPLFTMQGGLDKDKLHGIYKLIIKILIKALSSEKERDESDERMLNALTNGESYVSEENTAAFMEWYAQSKN